MFRDTSSCEQELHLVPLSGMELAKPRRKDDLKKPRSNSTETHQDRRDDGKQDERQVL